MLPGGALPNCGKVVKLLATKTVTRTSSSVRQPHVFFEPSPYVADEATEEEEGSHRLPLFRQYLTELASARHRWVPSPHRSSILNSLTANIGNIEDEEALAARIIAVGETQYCVRIGDGLTAPVTLFDGSQPSNMTVHIALANKEINCGDIKVASFADKHPVYRRQAPTGTAFCSSGGVLNYSFRTHTDNHVMCDITLHFGGSPLNVGRSFLSLDGSQHLGRGDMRLPIVNDTDTIIGTFDCNVVGIRGLEGGDAISPTRPMITTSTPLEIGHRGCGVTETDRELFDHFPCVPENTFSSLYLAYLHGADMVETDVTVTLDHRAVLYHDLEFHCSTGGTSSGSSQTLPLAHTTYNVLQNLPTPEVSASPDQRQEQLFLSPGDSLEEVQSGSKLFPELVDMLRGLPADLGIMLEVKTNLAELDTDQVAYHSDKNTYVDTVLEELIAHASNRRIILCSFCPTTCVMLRNKQARWPVVLIIQGSTPTYNDYCDGRLRSVEASTKLAISENLHGISVFTGLLQERPAEIVEELKQAGLATFVWGFHNGEQQYRDLMRACKVDGLIYDRIYEDVTLKKKLQSA